MPLCIVSNEHTPCMLTGEPMMIEKRTDINIDAVFNPITLGNIKIPNRFAMAPMTRSFSPGNVPDEKVAAYYRRRAERSEEHTSELQSLMRISYAVFCLTKKKR